MADPVIVPRRREDFFDSDGNPTLRFIRFLESLTDTTNEGTSTINDNAEAIALNTVLIGVNSTAITNNSTAISDNTDLISDNTDLININSGLIDETPIYSGFMAQIQFLQRQFDGLPEFTIDTSGFTTDTTFITTDKVIA